MAQQTLKDEYGKMDSSGETYIVPELNLECGTIMKDVAIRYKTFGQLNENRDNVMVVFHALTGNASLDSWWGDMLGPHKPFDTIKYFILCCNSLGSCYGSCGPRSINPETGKPYGSKWPSVTMRDSVNMQFTLLREELKVNGVEVAIGGSCGGMHALESGMIEGPLKPKKLILICSGAKETAWQIGFNEVQRQAIYLDPKWRNGDYPDDDPPYDGMKIARELGMITYRTHYSFDRKFGRKTQNGGPIWEDIYAVESYLRAQGTKLIQRDFDPSSYIALTKIVDSHDIARGRGESVEQVLSRMTQPTLVVGVTSDVLYPIAEQEELAKNLPNAKLCVLDTPEGHDGFLLLQHELAVHIVEFLTPKSEKSDPVDVPDWTVESISFWF